MIALARLTELATRSAPQQIALQDAKHVLNYRAMLEQLLLAEQWLRDHKIKRLAIRLDNSVSFVLWDLAAQLADVVCVPVPLFFTEAQQQHALASAGIDLLLLPDAYPLPAGERLNLPASNALSSGIAGWKLQPSKVPALPRGTSKITFTSGTTGTPKGVCLSSDNQWQVAQSLQAIASTLAIHSHLCVLPLAVLLENVAGVYSALLCGARVILPSLADVGLRGSSQFDAEQLLTSVARHEANSIILLPQMLSSIVALLEQSGAVSPLPSLRFAAVGGARVAPELLARADAVQLPVYEGYGLSECASVVAVNAPGVRRAGTVGKPLPHVRVRRAEDGELQVSGNAFLGYLGVENDAEQNEIATGDLGHFDADGFLQIQGRKKHLLITSFGRNVSPEWPESELLAEPAIAQVAIFGEAQPALSAVIVPQVGRTESDIAAAVERTNRRLPDYAQIQTTLVITEPFRADNQLLTSNGRPKRDAIWQRYGQALQAQNANPAAKPTADHNATLTALC